MSTRRDPWLGLFGRLVVRDIAVHVAIALLAAIALFVTIDSVEAVNRALSRATVADMLRLQLFNVPAILSQFSVFCVLIGTLTALCALVRRQEVAAMLSAGASPAAVLKPALLSGLALAIVFAGLTEWIAPLARAEVSAARRRLGLPPSPSEIVRGSRAWFRGADRVYRVEALEAADGSALAGVLILRIDDGRLIERWDAERLRFEDGRWIAYGVVQRTFSGEDDLTTARIERTSIALEESPQDFVRSIGAPDRLPYFALREATRARERLGQPAIAFRMELYKRLAHPLSLLVAAALGAAIALSLGRRPTLARALGLGATVGFVLGVLEEIGVALGSTSAVPSWAAAHVALALEALLAAWAWARAARRPLA